MADRYRIVRTEEDRYQVYRRKKFLLVFHRWVLIGISESSLAATNMVYAEIAHSGKIGIIQHYSRYSPVFTPKKK